MNKIKKLYLYIVEKINRWINSRLLYSKLDKLNISEDDLILFYLNREISDEFIDNASRTLGERYNGKYLFLLNELFNRVETTKINDNDVIQVFIPLETFYLWYNTGELEDRGKSLKEHLNNHGIENQLILLPDGYKYKVEDKERLIKSIDS